MDEDEFNSGASCLAAAQLQQQTNKQANGVQLPTSVCRMMIPEVGGGGGQTGFSTVWVFYWTYITDI